MKKKILYLGSSGFPYEPAAPIQRQIWISRLLIEAGYCVTVVCTKGTRSENLSEFKGNYESINYVYTSLTCKYFNVLILRILSRTFGRINEFIYIIIRSILIDRRDVIFLVNTKSYYLLKYYSIISRLINIRLIYDYVEYVKSLDSTNSYFKNNLELFDKSLTKLTDSFICISDFLIQKIQEKSMEKRIIKIPAITDFERFDKIKKNIQSENNYFLYCGVISYIEVIEFLIKSFEIIDNLNFNLIIITNGHSEAINDLKKIINKSEKHNQITVLTNLKFEDLVSLYKNALALLIPLRPTIKDIARFPHKISEYTASGRPIITTNIGEIKNYFIDNENAFFTTNYDVHEFGEKMEFVTNNKKFAENVGSNGRMIGEKYFDYRNYIKKIHNFIEN